MSLATFKDKLAANWKRASFWAALLASPMIANAGYNYLKDTAEGAVSDAVSHCQQISPDGSRVVFAILSTQSKIPQYEILTEAVVHRNEGFLRRGTYVDKKGFTRYFEVSGNHCYVDRPNGILGARSGESVTAERYSLKMN